jgi:MoaA/NifB/PqqE/SkfB family radical SAM enzyme
LEKHVRDRVRHVVEKNSLLSRVFAARLRAHYEARDAAADHAALAYLRSRNFMPTAVLIQISRACNPCCTMCGWAVWQRNRGYMKLELYKHILDELESNSIRQVNLTNPQGEPLLSPHAIECISLAVTRGFEVNLNTNCTPLGDKNID